MSNGTDAEPVLEVVETGQGVSLQDLGRRGWKRYGVPPGGALDPHAAQWANLLLDNPLDTPVLECLLAGARFRALREVEVAITGAAASGETQRWGTTKLGPDEELALPPPVAGVWTYLAVRGGFRATHWFGSVSVFPRGGLGEPPGPGARLFAPAETTTRPPRLTSVGARWLDPRERRDYRGPPAIRVWPGPQWDLFAETARAAIFDTAWVVSARSDRTGYRLEGFRPRGTFLPRGPVGRTSVGRQPSL